jgi:hypothetical protein
MRNNKIIYKIVIEDIQNVALETLDRTLTDEEINKIIDPIVEKIPWYDAIQDVISSKFRKDGE